MEDPVLDAVCNGLLAVGTPCPKGDAGECMGLEPLPQFPPSLPLLAAAGHPAPPAGEAAEEAAGLRLAAARAAARPRTLARAAAAVLRHFDREKHGRLEVSHVMDRARGTYAKLGLKRPSSLDLYLSVAVHDGSGRNALDEEELAAFLGELFSDCARLANAALSLEETSSSASTPPTTPRPPPLGPPPSPVDGPRVTLRTLAGELHRTSLPSQATTDDLRTALLHSPLVPPAALNLRQRPQHRFAVGGRVLCDGVPLEDQGLLPGDFVEVVRATPPPARVRLECEGLGSGPSVRGSCGTFRLMEGFRKNGRPIYARDRGRSEWNRAMLYHGEGERLLMYEEHPVHGGRWALTDDQDWSQYGDRAYAFVVGDAPHPGFLEGQRWHAFRDAKWLQRVGREEVGCWLEHSSLRLVVPEEQD